MKGRRRFRVLGLTAVLGAVGALGWTAQTYVDLVRLASAVVDSCARVETASRIRMELVENLLEGAGAAIGAETGSRLEQACAGVREIRLSPETLGDAASYLAFRRAQTDLSEALGKVWERVGPARAPVVRLAVTDLKPELERWSRALEQSLVEMERSLEAYRISIEGFPGSLLAEAVREGSPAIATQALAGRDGASAPAVGAVR